MLPKLTPREVDVAIAHPIAVGLVALFSLTSACRCEDATSAPPAPPATPFVTAAPSTATAAAPELEPARDGVLIPPTLVQQLSSEDTGEPEDGADEPSVDEAAADVGVRCALGCALIDRQDRVVIVRAQSLEEDGLPTRLSITRLGEDGIERQEIDLEGIDGDALASFVEEGGTPPWASRVSRALGAGPYRAAEDLVSTRAYTLFSLDEYAPLVALRAPLADRWLYAEVGPTAYRLHLIRADRSVARLLASEPLVATACNGDFVDRACVAPMSIEGAYLSPDGRTLHVLVAHPTAGDGIRTEDVLSVGIDDASALPSLYDETARSEELDRSLRAPGARTTPFVALDEAPTTREVRCLRGCALYRESGEVWVVRPDRIELGEAVALRVFAPTEPGSGLEVLGLERADAPARASLLARALAGAPVAEGRALVARQAIASKRGVASAARVELRAPHAGEQLGVEVDAGEYVLRWGRGVDAAEVARVPAIFLDGEASAPSLVEVFAPPDRGFPLVVVGVAASRSPTDPAGLEHRAFHAIVAALPTGAPRDPNASMPSRIQESR
jgi:hypothetical protein